MDRKWTPKVVRQGGPGAVREPLFSSLETLWAALGSHMVPRPPQRASTTPPDGDLLSFFNQNVWMFGLR